MPPGRMGIAVAHPMDDLDWSSFVNAVMKSPLVHTEADLDEEPV